MRNSTIFCEHSRFFAFDRNAMLSYFYFWYSCDNCIIQLRTRRIWRDDDFVTYWNENKNKNFDTIFSNNSVNVLCNDDQQLRIVYLFTFFAKSFVFSEVCVIVRFETAISRQSRQKNSIEWKKQQCFDDIFMISKHQKFSNVVIFDSFVFVFIEVHAFVKRSIQQTMK